jgi:FtsZ-binding cell division protein ZapB
MTEKKKTVTKNLRETIEISLDAIERLFDEVLVLREENQKTKAKIKSLQRKIKRLESSNDKKKNDDN